MIGTYIVQIKTNNNRCRVNRGYDCIYVCICMYVHVCMYVCICMYVHIIIIHIYVCCTYALHKYILTCI